MERGQDEAAGERLGAGGGEPAARLVHFGGGERQAAEVAVPHGLEGHHPDERGAGLVHRDPQRAPAIAELDDPFGDPDRMARRDEKRDVLGVPDRRALERKRVRPRAAVVRAVEQRGAIEGAGTDTRGGAWSAGAPRGARGVSRGPARVRAGSPGAGGVRSIALSAPGTAVAPGSAASRCRYAAHRASVMWVR